MIFFLRSWNDPSFISTFVQLFYCLSSGDILVSLKFLLKQTLLYLLIQTEDHATCKINMDVTTNASRPCNLLWVVLTTKQQL